jgi:gliding motility-associated-like protein
MVLVAVLAVPIGAAGQDPNDNLNLDFKNGLSGWKLYHGMKNLKNGECTWTHSGADGSVRIGSQNMINVTGNEDRVTVNKSDFYSKGYVMTPQSYYPDAMSEKILAQKRSAIGEKYIPEIYKFYVVSRGGADNEEGRYDINFARGTSLTGSKSGQIHENYNKWINSEAHVEDANYKSGGKFKCDIPHYKGLNNNEFATADGYSGDAGVDWRIPKSGGFPRACRIGSSYGIYDGYASEANNCGFGTGMSSVERMEYEFDCTKDMGILLIDYCAIAMNPSGKDDQCKNDHSPEGEPQFSIKLYTADLGSDNWVKYEEPCGEAAKTTAHMYDSKGVYGPDLTKFHVVTTGWSRTIFKLLPLQGKKVRLVVEVNDCCYGATMGSAGGHAAYMYFRSEVKPYEFDLEYCKQGDPLKVTAPTGYDYYVWSVGENENKAKELDANDLRLEQKNVYVSDKFDASVEGYVKVKFGMFANSDPECEGVLDTLIQSQTVEPDITFVDSCGTTEKGFYRFMDATKVKLGNKYETGFVEDRTWLLYPPGARPVIGGSPKDDFFDGLSNQFLMSGKINSIDEDESGFKFVTADGNARVIPDIIGSADSIKFPDNLAPEGQYVVLKVKTMSGCESYVCKKVRPRYTPVNTLKVPEVCVGDDLKAVILGYPTRMSDWESVVKRYLKNNAIPANQEEIDSENFEAGTYLQDDYKNYLGDLEYSADGKTWYNWTTCPAEGFVAQKNVQESFTKSFQVRDIWSYKKKVDADGNFTGEYELDENGKRIPYDYCQRTLDFNITANNRPVATLGVKEGYAIEYAGTMEGLPLYKIKLCSNTEANLYMLCNEQYKVTWAAFNNGVSGSLGFVNDMSQADGYDGKLNGRFKSLPCKVSPNSGRSEVEISNGKCDYKIVVEIEEVAVEASVETEPVCYPGPAVATVLNYSPNHTPVWYKEGESDPSKYMRGVSVELNPDFNANYYVSGKDVNNCTFAIPFQFKQIAPAEPKFVFNYRQDRPTPENVQIEPDVEDPSKPMRIKYDAVSKTYTFSPLCGSTHYKNNYVRVGFINPTKGVDNVVLSYELYDSKDAYVNWYKGSYQENGVTWNRDFSPANDPNGKSDKYRIVVKSHDRETKEVLCTQTYYIVVESVPTPQADIYAYLNGQSTTNATDRFCIGSEVILEANGRTNNQNLQSKDLKYTWYLYSTGVALTNQSPEMEGQQNGGSKYTIKFEVKKGGHSVRTDFLEQYQYGLKIEDANGCANNFTKTVYVKPNPDFSVTGPTVCVNDGIAELKVRDLYVHKDGSHSYNNSSIVGYKWDNADAFDVKDSVMSYGGLTGAKEVTVSVRASNECVTEKKVTINVFPEFDVKLEALRPNNDANLDIYPTAGGEFKICSGLTAGLVLSAGPKEGATGNQATSYTYVVKRRRDGKTVTSKDITSSSRTCAYGFDMPTVLIDNGVTETFDVTVTSSFGCVVKKSFDIQVMQRPSLSFDVTRTVVCEEGEEEEKEVTITAFDYSTDKGRIAKMEWLTAGVNDTVSTLAEAKLTGKVKYVPGSEYKDYKARITTTEGCLYEATQRIYHGRTPIFDAEAVPAELCEGASFAAKLNAKSDYKNTYFYTQNGKDSNGKPLWTSSWTDARVLKGPSSASFDASTGAIVTKDESFVVRAGNSFVGPSYKYYSDASANFCYATKTVTVTSKPVPAVTVDVLDMNNNVVTEVCENNEYKLRLNVSLKKGDDNQNGVVNLNVTRNGVDETAGGKMVTANSSVVIGPFTPGRNADNGIAFDRDELSLSWSLQGGDCGGSSRVDVSIVKLPEVGINEENGVVSGSIVCEGTKLELNSVFHSQSNATVGTYKWTSDKGLSWNVGKIEPTPSEGKNTYTLVITDSKGCVGKPADFEVEVIKAPEFTAWSKSDKVCDGCRDTILISDGKDMVGGYAYSIYGLDASGARLDGPYAVNEEFTVTGEDGVSHKYLMYDKIIVTENKQYEVVAKMSGEPGCEAKQNVAVNVSKAPVLKVDMFNATKNTTITNVQNNDIVKEVCPGDKIIFHVYNEVGDASSVTTYSFRRVTPGYEYTWTTKGTATGNTVYKTSQVTVDRAYKYEIKATSQDGCVSYFYVSVPVSNMDNIYTLGNYASNNVSYLCHDFGGNLTIECIGASGNYTWKASGQSGALGNQSTITVQPRGNASSTKQTSTSYIVTAENQYGCMQTVTHTIYFRPVPNFNVEAEKSPVCEDEEVKLTAFKVVDDGSWHASNNTSYTYSFDGSNYSAEAGYLYELTDVDKANGSKEFTVSANYNVISDRNGNYVSCQSKKKITVDVIYKPEFTVEVLKNGAVVNGGNKLCIDDEFSFRLKEVGTVRPQGYSDIVTYTITDEAAENAKAPQEFVGNFGGEVSSAAITADKTRTFLIKAKASKGCEEVTTRVTVSVEQPFDVRIISDNQSSVAGVSEVCEGGSLTLTALSNAAVWTGDGSAYQWSTGANADAILVKDVRIAEQTFTLKVRNSNGCWSNPAEHKVKANPNPMAIVDGDRVNCVGSNAEITANSSSVTSGSILKYTWLSVDGGANGTFGDADDVYTELSNGVTFDKPFVSGLNKYALVVESDKRCADTALFDLMGSDKPDIAVRKIVGTQQESTLMSCIGTPMTLQASNSKSQDNTFEWFNVNNESLGTGSQIIVTPASVANVIFKVKVKDGNGCESEKIFTYGAYSLPNLSVVGNTSCEGVPNKMVASDLRGDDFATEFYWNNSTVNNKEFVATFAPNSGPYTVVAKDKNGCRAEKIVDVIVNANPTAMVKADRNQVCHGGVIELTAETSAPSVLWQEGSFDANGTINWGNVSISTSKTITPIVTAKKAYKFTAQDGKCQSESAPFIVSPFNQASFVVSNATVCAGQDATINISNSKNVKKYYWKELGGDYKEEETVSFVIPADANEAGGKTKTYRIYGVSNDDCITAEEEFTVTINSLPTVEIDVVGGGRGGEAVRCDNGGALVFQAKITSGQTANSYEWSGSTVDQTNESKSSYSGVADNHKVRVRIVDNNGCAGVAERSVTVYNHPVIALLPTEEDGAADASIRRFCAGGEVTLEVDVERASSNISNYTWEVGGTEMNWSQGSRTIALKDGATYSETYSVQVVDENQCVSNKASYTVNVEKRPEITHSEPTPVCPGNEVSIQLSGADRYFNEYGDELTLDGNNNFTEVIKQAKKFSFVGSVTLQDGVTVCYSDPVTVDATVRGIPFVSISEDVKGSNLQSKTVLACEGETLTLTAVVTGGDGKYTYSWNGAAADAVYKPTLSGGGNNGIYTYDLVVRDGGGIGCPVTASVNFKAQPTPVVSISTDKDAVCNASEAVNLKACTNADCTVDEEGKYSYNWLVDGEVHSSGVDVNSMVLRNVKDPTKVSVTVKDIAVGCIAAPVSITIDKLGAPEFTIYDAAGKDILDPDYGNVMVCPGDYEQLIVEATGDEALSSYKWRGINSDDVLSTSQNFNTPVFEEAKEARYIVEVEGQNGCFASKNFSVTVKPLPNFTLAGPRTGLCEGTTATFTVSSLDKNTTFDWLQPVPSTENYIDVELKGSDLQVKVAAILNGCSVAKDSVFKIYQNPVIDIVTDAEATSNSICEGSFVQLEAKNQLASLAGKVTWSWRKNTGTTRFGNEPVISDNPNVTTTYTLTGTARHNSSNICVVSKDIVVNVIENPEIRANFHPSAEVCSNESVELRLDGADFYAWNKGAAYDEKNSEELAGSTIAIGTDFVVGTTNNYTIAGMKEYKYPNGTLNCVSEKTVGLKVYAAPSVSVSAPSKACPDTEITLIATGADSYSWVGTGKLSDGVTDLNGATSSIINLVPGSSDKTYSYSVIGTEIVDVVTQKRCSTKANVAVEVLPKSKISFGEVKDVCIGDYAVIKATGVSIGGKQPYVDFIWSTGEMGDSISYLITEDSKITVTGRDTNNCFVDETVEIKAQDPAGFDISLDPSVNTKVCEGSAVTLKVVGATKYKWEDDPENTSSQMQVSPESNTTYTVEGTYGVCTKKLTIPVEIVSAPAISIVGNTVVCRNSTMELQATSQTTGLVFKWEGTDAAGDKLSVVPTIDGEKYIVTATDPDGKYCKASKSVTVTLREAPEVKISGDLTVCENTYADLNVGGAVSYVWGYEDADGNPVNNVAGGTNYQPKMEDKDLVVFVDGTDSYGCKGFDKKTVSHVAPPSVEINGVDQICAGQTVSLTAGGNAETYIWNGKDTSASVNEALETSKTYSLKGISTEGCVAETRLLVTVVQNPILSLSGNTTLCQGDMLRVKAHGADTYIWGGGASPDGYPDSMSMKMPEAGIKEVALTGVTGGCSTTQNFEINVKKAPSVQIEGDKETCANVSLPLKAVSEDEITSYTWTNNLNNVSLAGQSVSPVITQDVTYTVKAGNIYGCAGTDEINVKVVSSPDLIVSANIEFGKPLRETTLEFNDLGVAYVSVCDGTDLDLQVRGAKTFKWDHRDSVYTSYTSLDTTITSSATFVVTGFITGCDASRTIVVNHKANPSIDLLGKRVVCEGSPVTLEPIGTDSFEWNGKGVVPEEDGSKLIAFTPTVKDFKYTLVGIDTVNNCQTVRTYTDITFTGKPEFKVEGEKEVCVNESVMLKASAVDPANDEGNYSYNWGYDKDSKKAFDLDSELEVTAFEAGVDKFFASVKDAVGCVDTLFFEVTKKPLPTLTFDAKGSDNDPSTPEIIDICMKNDLYAYINSGGASVTQENGKVSSTIKDKPVKDTIYKVTGALNGCVNTLEIPVRTIPSPIVYLTNYAEDEDLTYCEGSPVKLVVGGNAVSYTMPDGTKGTNGATYVDEEADGLMTYFITGEGDNGCSVQEEFTFKMNTLPDVAIDIEKDQDRICYREVAELHVTGAESYKWSTGSRKDTIRATITKDSVFTVVGKDGNGCESEVSFKVTMVELPVLAYNGDTEFCDGNTATLRGSGTGVGGGDYYAWSVGKDTIAMGNLATTKLNGNTTYTLWGKSKEGCVSSLDVDITAKEAPILFWEGEYELNETADSILLCQKQTLDITMKGADTYQWTGGSTTDRLTVVPTRSTHYTVTGTGANGCKTTQAINVKVLPTPTIKIDAPTFACVGEDFQMKVTDDTKDNFESFAWSNHSTEATSGDLTMTEEDYTLKVTGYTSLNCPAEASFTVKPKALPKLYVRGTKEICKGGVFSLHGQGANTYAWFMDENGYYGNDTAKVGDQISFEAATDEVLVMSGTLNGCTDTIHVPLSVQTPPILHTEGLKPICQGEVLELTAKATNVNEEDKVEFTWSTGTVTGENGEMMSMTPLSSQNIYLSGSVVLLDENGDQIFCKNTLEIPVTVNPKPTIKVEGERNICFGSEAELTAVGAAAYEWVELSSSETTVRPIITSDTSFTVKGKVVETGCDAEAVVKVKVKPLPVLGVAEGSKLILCDGEEADITVFGAATYGWKQPDGSLVAGNRYRHTPEQDTIYRVIGTSNNNCVDSFDIEVSVNMLPSLSYSGDSEICSGESLVLFGHSAPEGCTFSWSNGDKGDKMEAKPLVSATYTLTGKDGNGCVTSMEIPVVVNQRTPLNLAGTSNVCAGSQAEVYVVDAEGFTAFNWSNGNVGENIKPHVSEKTTFTAEGVDVNGCVTKAEFTVNVTEIPELSFHGDTVVCLGDEVSLLADGASKYNWRDVDGNLLSDKARYTFKPDVETKLILEGYMSNCKAEREIPIMVNAVPNLEVDMPEFICRGSVGELRATAGAGVTFEWSTGETEKVIEVAPNKSTYYTVTATNEHGCDSTVKRTVLVVEPPMVTMGTNKLNDMVCPGQPDSVYFSATGAVSYEWSSVPAVADIDIYNSDKQNFWAVLNEGEDVVVTVVGTDAKGCQTSVTRTIAQRELEPMQFVINPNCIDNDNPSVRFSGKVPDHENAVWTWTPGEDLEPITVGSADKNVVTYKYDLPLKDSFEVKVRSVDEHGCIQDGSGWVYKWRDFWAAEAFTPNGDERNDEFYFHGGDFIEEFSYIIYNRMGEVIFEGKSIDDKWDGNYKGEPCPTGVYGWTVKYGNNSATLSKKGERKGMVTIVR